MTFDAVRANRWWKREQEALANLITKEEAGGYPKLHRDSLDGFVAGVSTAGAAITALGYLANWMGAVGCQRVLDGKEEGFDSIDRSCVYAYWKIRLLARGYDANTNANKQPRAIMENVAVCWMHAEASGVDEVRDWIGERIRHVDGGDASLGGKDMNELCTLMAHFVTGKDEEALRTSGWAALRPYERVVAGLGAADYDDLAVHHAASVDGAAYPAFHFYPYRLVPFELHAIEKRTGISIPGNQHPLLGSPLAKRRQTTIGALPDELKPVICRMRTLFDV